MVYMTSRRLSTDNGREVRRGAIGILNQELSENASFFSKTKVIFGISLFNSTIYQKIVLALQFSFKKKQSPPTS